MRPMYMHDGAAAVPRRQGSDLSRPTATPALESLESVREDGASVSRIQPSSGRSETNPLI